MSVRIVNTEVAIDMHDPTTGTLTVGSLRETLKSPLGRVTYKLARRALDLGVPGHARISFSQGGVLVGMLSMTLAEYAQQGEPKRGRRRSQAGSHGNRHGDLLASREDTHDTPKPRRSYVSGGAAGAVSRGS